MDRLQKTKEQKRRRKGLYRRVRFNYYICNACGKCTDYVRVICEGG